MHFAIQLLIYFIGLILVYRAGRKHGYDLGFNDAMVLRVKQFIEVKKDESSKDD